MATPTNNSITPKVGRPKKQLKKDQRLTVVCTESERFYISKWAKEKGLTVSDYLRSTAFIQVENSNRPEFSREARPLLVQLNFLIGKLKELLEHDQGLPFTALKQAGIRSTLQQINQLQTTLLPYVN
ncbi:MAG: hypothetical protein HYU71_08355 [Bacteroidetes bacterium]|nr:hypothetical protein [Bacteroidota bacterium]